MRRSGMESWGLSFRRAEASSLVWILRSGRSGAADASRSRGDRRREDPGTGNRLPEHAPIPSRARYLPAFLVTLVFFAYYLANPESGSTFDYTFRIADALIHGRLGLVERPPSWLNEMIPHNGTYYSAFPLGSVITMIPVAAVQQLRGTQSFPGVLLAALVAGLITFLLFLLSARYHQGPERRAVLTLLPVLGTWLWPNLAYGAAWQVALGVAVAGQLAALYFILITPRPLLAGLSFAVAFGNRTEIILLAPVFLYLLRKTNGRTAEGGPDFRKAVVYFIAAPLVLGLATLLYNYARFDSLGDFGYARIPGVLDEPWYRHGLFSIDAIPENAYRMLLEPWRQVTRFPYLTPTGFGGSILLSCPYLILLFRQGARDAALKPVAWCAIGLLTAVLWLHGNPGGWQISYRYAAELLPWMFLIFLESSPEKVTRWEAVLFGASVAMNVVQTCLFLRSDAMQF